MNAPDKIYIWNAGGTLLKGWTQKQRNPTSDIEYIRKDLLLEWAKKQYREYVNNPFYAGERDAYTQLIKKLNSL